ncbi:MAG: hypothetical protein JNK49_20300 [Planctomycetes bacterium]|nr:hypothetical protein [Planctomycetota bacterium]
MKSKFTPVACLAALALASCSGMRSAEGQATVHAESFRFFGIAIPHDDQAKAAQMAKEHLASQDTSMSTPADWTSFCGILGNIMGFHSTAISGKAK